MKLTLGAQIHVHTDSPALKQMIKESLRLPDPVYATMLRMGKPVWWMKPYREYYREAKDGTIYIPRGCEKSLTDYLVLLKNIRPIVTDNRVSVPLKTPFSCSLALREYQKPAFDSITSESGLIRLGTGYGKSVFALKLVEKWQQKTLIIVPRSHLLEQYRGDIQKHCKLTPAILSTTKPLTDSAITLSTIQTLASMARSKNLSAITDTFGMVIVDECQNYITKKRLAIIQSFPAKYYFGMTATPERTDQQDKAIGWIFGKTLVDADLPQRKPTVHCYYSNCAVPVREYADIIKNHIEDEERNVMVADIVQNMADKGYRVLVLTKRVDHIELIRSHIADTAGHYALYAQAKEKNELLDEFRKNTKEFSVIWGTYSLLATGTDIPSLDCLVFAGDLKSNVLSRQAIGRILRLFDGKKEPIVIDIVDHLNPILFRQFKHRKKLYTTYAWHTERKYTNT